MAFAVYLGSAVLLLALGKSMLWARAMLGAGAVSIPLSCFLWLVPLETLLREKRLKKR